MAYEHLCMYCFEDKGSRPVCPHCGRDSRAAVPAIQLMPGTLLHNGRFLVGRARGQDANGIVYAAYDTRKNAPLRIREYLPRESARRQGDGSVSPAAGSEASFAAGMDRLRQSVESVEDPRKRHFFFEENGTGYIAERHSAAAAGAAGEADEGDGRNVRQIAIIVGIAVVVVLGVALAVIHLMNRAVDVPITPVTTLAPETTMWMPEASPTPTPYVGTTIGPIHDPDLSWLDYVYPGDVDAEYDALNPTAKATATPVITPTPAPVTPQPETTRVTESSRREQILELQNILVRTGWLDADDVSGRYDNATIAAVRNFQRYMNESYAIDPKLDVDGQAGPKTLYWLYQYNVSTKPTPTPEPTPEPTVPPRITARPGVYDVIDETSNSSRVKSVQVKLITLDLLPEGSADGIYGASTREAVIRFQQVVNKLQGRTVLSENGICDADTLAYLQYYADWWPANKPTPTPSPTPTPRPTPTPGPTPTPTPVPPEENIVVDANSDQISIRYVQSMLSGLRLLPAGGVDGVYGPGTSEAIRSFQQKANQLLGNKVLPVTGQCDALTLQYMEMYYEQYVGTAPTTPGPEATPTPENTLNPIAETTDTPEPGEESQISVGADSDPDSIRFVQQMLSQLGLLDASGVDGSFGGGTTRALQAFQQRVNELNGSAVLRTDGLCDATTLQYLEYYSEQVSQQTQTPEDQPTEAPIEQPTEEPAEAPTETGALIDAGSAPEEITAVQQMLAQLGLMDAGSVDGSFGDNTTRALQAFQQRVNELNEGAQLRTDGVCDAATLRYLDQYAAQVAQNTPAETQPAEAVPTEAPEETAQPEETPAPEAPARTAAVDANSDAAAIREVQGMLAELGMMSATGVDGSFGSGTAQAIMNFQARVNELTGSATLEEDGVCDEETLRYLRYYVEEVRSRATEQATEAPTEAPAETQSETPNASAAVVDAGSSADSVRQLQSMLADVGLLSSGAVDGVYGNGTAQAIRSFQERVNELRGAGTVAVSGVCDSQTMEYLEYYSAEMRRRNGEEDYQGGEDPTQQGEEQTGEEAQVAVGADSDPESIRYVQTMLSGLGLLSANGVDGSFGGGTTRALQAFQQRVNELNGASTLRTDGACDAATLQYLEYYYESVQSSATPEPQPTEAATPEPTEAPVVGSVKAPNISVSNVIATDGGVRYVGGTCTISWTADGDVDRYYVYVADSNGTEYVNKETTDTSIDIPGKRMTPGRIYTARIGVMPTNGQNSDAKWSSVQFSLAAGEETTAAPAQDSSYMPSTISASSDAASIEKMQRALHSGGWLSSGSKGEFDHATRQAVAEFQTYMNETYADDPNYTALPVIDPGSSGAVVDSRTLNMIMHGYR